MTGQPNGLRPWERWVGHVGYVAEGTIYLLLGLYALVAEFERKRQPNGSVGALTELGTTAIGKALLVILAAGLAAFVLWHLILAVVDPEHRPQSPKFRRLPVRLGHLFTALLYAFLVGQALWHLLGNPDSGLRSQAQWTHWAVRFGWGRVVVAGVGISVAIVGIAQFYRAVTHDKTKRVDLSDTWLRLPLNVLGIYGYASRGTLFTLVGLSVMAAAWRLEPHHAGGIADTLNSLQEAPHGSYLLGVLALGLMCFGVFQIAKERFRRFTNHERLTAARDSIADT